MEFALGLLVGAACLAIARVVLLGNARKVAPPSAEPSPETAPVAPPIDENAARAAVEARVAAYEAELVEEAQARAKKVVLEAVQRTHLENIPEASTDVVTLPADDVKGRLIGREGRNIRAFEQVTGVDLIIDDAPNTVTLSTFDPYRRAIARETINRLVQETKVYPAKVEEVYEAARKAIDAEVQRAGADALAQLGIKDVSKPVREAIGRMRYRTSYAQNIYAHSIEVAQICGMLADELGLDRAVAMRAGLLHDLGKALPPEWEGPHALAGMRFLQSHGESPKVCNAVGAHHREIPLESPEAELVIVADSLSGARPGARRESLEQFLSRMKALEEEVEALEGVERVFAVQAGREVRVIVKPDAVNDQQTAVLAQQIAEKIAGDPRFPGQIKVTVIREIRSEFTGG